MTTVDSTARLVTSADDAQQITEYRAASARGALARGLKEYLETLSIDWAAGKQVRFRKVFRAWAEPEDMAEYPTAAILTPDPLGYGSDEGGEAAPFTPSVVRVEGLRPGRYVVMPTECIQTLTITCWCTNQVEREAVAAMLEDGLNPVTWMYGVRLELPYYHGVRAEYELLAMTEGDTESDVAKRARLVTFAVKGRLPLIRIVDLGPPLHVRTELALDPPELDPPTAAQAAQKTGRIGVKC